MCSSRSAIHAPIRMAQLPASAEPHADRGCAGMVGRSSARADRRDDREQRDRHAPHGRRHRIGRAFPLGQRGDDHREPGEAGGELQGDARAERFEGTELAGRRVVTRRAAARRRSARRPSSATISPARMRRSISPAACTAAPPAACCAAASRSSSARRRPAPGDRGGALADRREVDVADDAAAVARLLGVDAADAHVDHDRALADLIRRRPSAAGRSRRPAGRRARRPRARSRVREWQTVTVALAWSRSCAIGLPKRFERPITTASIPPGRCSLARSISITPAGVHGRRPGRPSASRPAFWASGRRRPWRAR